MMELVKKRINEEEENELIAVLNEPLVAPIFIATIASIAAIVIHISNQRRDPLRKSTFLVHLEQTSINC
jgi:hypothetical protein